MDAGIADFNNLDLFEDLRKMDLLLIMFVLLFVMNVVR